MKETIIVLKQQKDAGTNPRIRVSPAVFGLIQETASRERLTYSQVASIALEDFFKNKEIKVRVEKI